MISKDVFKFNKIEMGGIFEGVVEDINDPESLKRCRVRISGLFDEPIKKEHIPWAYPISQGSNPPQVGDVVFVIFKDGDLYKPRVWG